MIDTFGQISIFDKASHERLTETFNFKTSGVSIVGESKAIFEISNPNPDMMLVIRLDKSFEGSLSDWFDSYAKGKLPGKIHDTLNLIC